MKQLQEIIEKINKLEKEDKLFLIFELLKYKDIDFIDISKLYTGYLKELNNKKETEKRLLAGCLSSKYLNKGDLEYIDARSSILLYPYVPNAFIKEYVVKGVSKKAIEKEKKLLKEELKIETDKR